MFSFWRPSQLHDRCAGLILTPSVEHGSWFQPPQVPAPALTRCRRPHAVPDASLDLPTHLPQPGVSSVLADRLAPHGAYYLGLAFSASELSYVFKHTHVHACVFYP